MAISGGFRTGHPSERSVTVFNGDACVARFERGNDIWTQAGQSILTPDIVAPIPLGPRPVTLTSDLLLRNNIPCNPAKSVTACRPIPVRIPSGHAQTAGAEFLFRDRTENLRRNGGSGAGTGC